MAKTRPLAIVFCVHHKPYLIQATLISVIAQGFKDFDIYFLHQVGDGENIESKFYQEYSRLVQQHGVNPHLDPYDMKTIEACNLKRSNVFHVKYKNDHALDSGAWYKFIRDGAWKNYDYLLFLGEGAILTRDSIISDTMDFMKTNGVHFISGSQEKRCISRSVAFSNNRAANNNDMNLFHDNMINEVFGVFRRDHDFEKVFKTWPENIPVLTENHVPDIWGIKGWWQKAICSAIPNRKKGQIGRDLSMLKGLFDLYNRSLSAIVINLISFAGFNVSWQIMQPHIFVNGARKRLDQVVDRIKHGKSNFHKENSPQWFGCCCNHFMSRELVEKFSERLEKHHIYDFFDVPYAGSALEVIWGMVPGWLGYDKWFFDGIHRVRKNFVNYRREDDIEGMIRYLNRYYMGKFIVIKDGENIKVSRINRRIGHLKELQCVFG